MPEKQPIIIQLDSDAGWVILAVAFLMFALLSGAALIIAAIGGLVRS